LHFGLKCDDDWQANHYLLSQTRPEKTKFPIEIVSGTGQFYKEQLDVNGVTIEYTSYGVKDGLINVGTYYPVQ
jgi:hypothetical protein